MSETPKVCPFCGEAIEDGKCDGCDYEVGKVAEHTFITIDDDNNIEVIKMTDQVLLDNQDETVFEELGDDGEKDVFYIGGPDEVKSLRIKLKDQPVLQ
jgi:hypothetical protein